MSYANPQRKSLPWIHGWFWITLLAFGSMLFLALQFVWKEVAASAKLQSFRAAPVVANAPEFAALDLAAWLNQHASKKATQDWLDVHLILRSPYIHSQIQTLLTLPSDELPDEKWRKEAFDMREQGALVGWMTQPELLKKFIDENRGLIDRLYSLCEDEELVYLPLLSNGTRTLLPDILDSSTYQLIFLACEQAIREQDSVAVGRCIQTLERLHTKFHYPVYGIARWSTLTNMWWYAAIHKALDAEYIDRADRQALLKRLLDASDPIEETLRTGLVSRWQKSEEQAEQVWKGEKPWQQTDLPSVRWNAWSEDKATYRNAIWNDPTAFGWAAAWEDYRDSVVVRLAILEYVDRNQKTPESLSQLTSIGLTERDWTTQWKRPYTTEKGNVPFKYERSSNGQSAGLYLHRHDSLHFPPEIPLQSKVEFGVESNAAKNSSDPKP
jgi:hypothetical protein